MLVQKPLCRTYINLECRMTTKVKQKHSTKFGPGTRMSCLPRLPHFSACEASPAAQRLGGGQPNHGGQLSNQWNCRKKMEKMTSGWSIFSFPPQFPWRLQAQDRPFFKKKIPGKINKIKSDNLRPWKRQNLLQSTHVSIQYEADLAKSIWIYLNLSLFNSLYPNLTFLWFGPG